MKDLTEKVRPRTLWEETPERETEVASPRSDISELKEKVRRLVDRQHETQVSVDNLPVLRDAIVSSETRVKCLRELLRK